MKYRVVCIYFIIFSESTPLMAATTLIGSFGLYDKANVLYDRAKFLLNPTSMCVEI